MHSDVSEDAEGLFFTPPSREAGINRDSRHKINENALVSDTDSDDFAIYTGTTRLSRSGRADWNLLSSWDRAQVPYSEIQSELLRLATELKEQSDIIEWPCANHDDDIERLGLWLAADVRGSSEGQ